MNFKYYLKLVKARLMLLMEYRANLLMITLGSYGYNFVTLIFIATIFSKIDSLAGWNKYQVLFLYGTSELIVYLYSAFFENASSELNKVIRTGGILSYLLKPLNPLFNILTSGFILFEIVPSLALAIGILIYSGGFLNITLGVNFWIYLILCIVGIFIQVFYRSCVSLLAFWFTDSRELIRLSNNISDQHTYLPATVYGPKLRTLFSTIIPVALISYVPSYTLLFGFNGLLILNMVGVLIFFYFLMIILWKLGLKSYSGVSG